MNRREFLGAAGAAGAATVGGSLLTLPLINSFAGATPLPSRLIPEDKGFSAEQLAALRLRGQRRIYREHQRYAIGMPCGGIAAGQLYILGDGTLGGWHIDGRLNATGYGSASYQTRRPPRELNQGFRIVIGETPGQRRGYALADAEAGGDYDAIEFIGEYPIAEVHYKNSDTARVPPLEVTLRAGSPFVPLNSRDSTMPCTLMRFTLRNRGDQPVAGALQGWLENAMEPSQPGRPSAVRRNRVVRDELMTGVLMDAIAKPDGDGPKRDDRLLYDFEQNEYRGWTIEGEAFGAAPPQGAQRNQNPVSGFAGKRLVNTYAGSDAPTGRINSEPITINRRYMTFLIGGGNDARRTCMNLLIDGKIVRSATGANNERLAPDAWDVREFEGKQATLEIVDAASGPWGHINVDHIMLVDRLPAELQQPRPDSLTNGSMCLSFVGQCRASAGFDVSPIISLQYADEWTSSDSSAPAGVLECPFTLAPGESWEATFIISWHFPNLHTGHGRMYANWFDDAQAVAKYVAANVTRLADETQRFRETFYEDTTLPWWLALRLMMPVANLATGTYQWWKDGRAWGWEGVGCCHGTCTHVWNYAHAEARLFPDMSRSTRFMQDLGTAFEANTGRVAFRGEVDGGFEFAADGQAGTVLKCLREHLCSSDDAFLKEHWSRIKLAMDYLITRDAEQNGGQPDGVIWGRQHNTYDIDFVGANTFVGSLYLAALHAAAFMADRMNDKAAATQYRDIARKGREWTEANLFNGEYFVQKVRPGENMRFQYGEGCLADQLFGQNWARVLDLPTVYDEAKVRTALRSVYRYAWSPQVGTYNADFPPERVFARDREGGLFVCTWPKGGRPGEPIRYRDEVWTGIEYQVAAGMMWEGMVDEALVLTKAVDDRYDGALHNPWNEVECGDHYARALASWGVLQATMGYAYDGPAGAMGMSPRITPENFAAFFTAAEGWGLLSQQREDNSQINTIDLRWGSVRLRSFHATLPEAVDAARVRCSALVGGQSTPVTIEHANSRFVARFNADVTIEARGKIEFRWTW